jgi:hypothetical protein
VSALPFEKSTAVAPQIIGFLAVSPSPGQADALPELLVSLL